MQDTKSDVSRVVKLADAPARKNPNGSESWDIFKATTITTGERVRVHESNQPAGTVMPALHVIQHTEIICVREGVLELHHDGKVERAQAGDIIFVAKGTNHAVRNAGDGPASYFVVAVGGDV